MAITSTNSSLLRSLTKESPVREGLFVENSHKKINEPHRGDLSVNVAAVRYCAINRSQVISFLKGLLLPPIMDLSSSMFH